MKKIILILIFSTAYYTSFGMIQYEIDSLKQLTKITKIDTVLIDNYLLISTKYLQEDNDSSLVYAQKALHLAKKNSNDKRKSVALTRIGLVYFNLGDLPNALTHYNQSLIIANATNYSLSIAHNYKLIGALHGYEKKYKKSLNYQFKALKILYSLKDTLNIAKTYDNVATYYRKLAIYDSSMHYLNLAIEINNEIRNYRSLCFNYNNMGSLFLKDNKYDRAEKYYLKSLALRKKLNLKQDLLQSYNSLGNLFHITEEYNKAISYFNSCIQISKEIKLIKHLPLFYNNLSSSYYEQGNFRLALKHRKNEHRLTDSINSTKTKIRIANAEMENRSAKEKYQQILLQQELIEIEKINFKKSILISILIIITLIGLYIIIYSAKHYKLKDNLLNKEASLDAIKGAEKILSEKENSAQKVNIAQEILTSEIANLLNTEVTLELKKVQDRLENYKLTNPEADRIVTKEAIHITEAIQFINNISSNLLPATLDKKTLIEAIDNYLNNAFGNLNTQVVFKHDSPKIINYLEKELSHNIYRIIQELITNAIKYAEATIIKVEINSSTDHLLLRVLDNGIGFDNNNNNNKAGLGLNNVKYRAFLYNGNTIITSKKGKGTEILIDMNYKKS